MKIGTNLGNLKPYFSLEKALSKTYEVKVRKAIYKTGKKKGRVSFSGIIFVPQILVGRKVKLKLQKEQEENK